MAAYPAGLQLLFGRFMFLFCFHLCWLWILGSAHGELSAEKTPTCHKVFLLLKKIQMEWEDLHDNPQYYPVKNAIQASLDVMEKWCQKTDDMSIYFVSHGNVDRSLVIDSSEIVLVQFLTLLKNAHIWMLHGVRNGW